MTEPAKNPGFTPDQLSRLTAKLNAEHVKKNPKGFDYVEGWHAIAEANRIFGHDGWNRVITDLTQVAQPYQTGDKWRVAYRATVRITVVAGGCVIMRDGTGYGSGINKDLNDAHEGAVKEAETDAMKRALMTFGNPFGLALYDKEKENVDTTPHHLQPDAIAAFEADVVRRLAACVELDDIEEVWRADVGVKLREIGTVDKPAQNRITGLFSTKKAEILKRQQEEGGKPDQGQVAPSPNALTLNIGQGDVETFPRTKRGAINFLNRLEGLVENDRWYWENNKAAALDLGKQDDFAAQVKRISETNLRMAG